MKISVLTPSFNSGKYIERAIKSVLNQNYFDWEHIIMDGGSTDNTIEIFKKYDHLKWISKKDNGQSDAMNKAFNLSTGDIIVYLNADDEIEPNLFSDIINIFSEKKEIDAIVGNVNCNLPTHNYYSKSSILFDEIVEINKDLCFPLNPVGYYYKRKVQEEIGPFPENEHMAMDYWFILRLYKNYKLEYIDRSFGTYHIDGFNKSSNIVKSRVGLNGILRNFIYENNLINYEPILDEFAHINLKNAYESSESLYNLSGANHSLCPIPKRIATRSRTSG